MAVFRVEKTKDFTPEKRLARQKEYIATVRQVQEAVEKVQTIQEATRSELCRFC